MSDSKTPQPGIYEGVPFEEYKQWDAHNNSSLGPALISAAHYKAALEKPRVETASFRFGSLAHAGRLDSRELLQKYAVMPDFTKELSKEYKNPRNTSEYKQKVADWEEQHKGKIIVEQQEYDDMIQLVASLESDDMARELFSHEGPNEVSFVWVDEATGMLCKGRADKVDHKRLRFADLKTTCSIPDFQRHLYDFGYHRQSAFYTDGLKTLTKDVYEGWYVPVEKKPPFTVAAAQFDYDALTTGRYEYRKALQTIKEAKRTGNFRHAKSPKVWSVPVYKQPPVELVISNETVIL